MKNLIKKTFLLFSLISYLATQQIFGSKIFHKGFTMTALAVASKVSASQSDYSTQARERLMHLVRHLQPQKKENSAHATLQSSTTLNQLPRNSSTAEVPTIDIAPLFGNDIKSKWQVADQIHKACRGSGFFYISNHGIDIEAFKRVVNAFHKNMTTEEKWNLAIRAYNKNNPRIRNGYYMPNPAEKKYQHSYCYLNPNFTKEHPMIKSNTPMHEVNIWPDASRHPGFQSFCEKHYEQMFDLSLHLLRGFALALGKDEKFFDAYFRKEDTLSSVSLIKYPYINPYPPVKIAPDGTELGFPDHLDISLITVLCQSSIQNLQVEIEGKFVDIAPSADKFLVNCGTHMTHITHNYFHAPNHRVKHVNAERFSLPFFVNLGHHSTIQPFHPHDTGRKNTYLPISYGSYLQKGLQKLIDKNGQT